MPKETFLKLSREKQQKVIHSAKKEFARVPIQEVSIKNIVEDAEIARGSFYQYFESKEDLLNYILSEKIEETNQKLQNKIKECKNLFDTYVYLYDLMIQEFVDNDEKKLFKQIFENVKSSDENIFNLLKKSKLESITKYFEVFDLSNLKIENKKEFEIICDMLNIITRRAIVKNFKHSSKEKSRKEFLMQIDYIKYGIIKKEEENV